MDSYTTDQKLADLEIMLKFLRERYELLSKSELVALCNLANDHQQQLDQVINRVIH